MNIPPCVEFGSDTFFGRVGDMVMVGLMGRGRVEVGDLFTHPNRPSYDAFMSMSDHSHFA